MTAPTLGGARRYAVFLRGINVAGIKVSMPELRSLCEDLGFREVQTWLNTGNLALTAELTADDLKALLQERLSERFGYEAYVIVREAHTLAATVAAYPFGSTSDEADPDEADSKAGAKAETHHRYVLICEPGAAQAAYDAVEAAGGPGDEEALAVVGKDLFWRCPKGSSTSSPVAKVLARKAFKSTTTARNLNTVERML